MAEQAKTGDVKILAVTTEKPVEGIDAPTLKSLGIDLVFTNWRGIVAPPGAVRRRKQAFIDLLDEDARLRRWKQTLADQGWTDAFQTGDEFKTFLRTRTTGSPGCCANWGWCDEHHPPTTRPRAIAQDVPQRAARRSRSCSWSSAAGRGRRTPVLDAVSRRRAPVGPAGRIPLRRRRAAVSDRRPAGDRRLRGGHGEAEAGEDVDLGHGSDWKTVGLLAAAFVANILLIERLGWPVSGAVLFFGTAYALGSRHLIRNAIISIALSVGTWYLFDLGAGHRPAGRHPQGNPLMDALPN